MALIRFWRNWTNSARTSQRNTASSPRFGARLCRLEPLEQRMVLSVITPPSEPVAIVAAESTAVAEVTVYPPHPLADVLDGNLIVLNAEYRDFLAAGGAPADFVPSNPWMSVTGTRAYVTVTMSQPVDDLNAQVEALGMEIDWTNDSGRQVTGYIEFDLLDELAQIPDLREVTGWYSFMPSGYRSGEFCAEVLDPDLLAVYREWEASDGDLQSFTSENPNVDIDFGDVHVNIESTEPLVREQIVDGYLVTITDEHFFSVMPTVAVGRFGEPGEHSVTAWLPVCDLRDLARLTDVAHVSAVPPGEQPDDPPPDQEQDGDLPADAEDLGVVDFRDIEIAAGNAGEHWYRLEAVRDGVLTVAQFPPPFELQLGALTLFASDGEGELVELASGSHRIDYGEAVAGQEYLLRITTGEEASDWKIANLLQVDDDSGQVRVFGSDGEDIFSTSGEPAWIPEMPTPPTIGASGSNVLVTINGLMYFAADPFILAGEGDHVTLNGANDGDDHIQLGGFFYTSDWTGPRADGRYSGEWGSIGFSGGSKIVVNGYGGDDTASLSTSDENATLGVHPDEIRLWEWGIGRRYVFADFESVEVFVWNPGDAQASFYDSDGDDVFTAGHGVASIVYADGTVVTTHNFPIVEATGLHGEDTAEFIGSAATDTFVASQIEGPIIHFAGGGENGMGMIEVPGPPRYGASLTGDGYTVSCSYFKHVHADLSQGGDDVAFLYDSLGDDKFRAAPTSAKLELATGYDVVVDYCRYVHAYATRGTDVACLYGNDGDDFFLGTPVYGKMYTDTYLNRAKHFDYVHAYGGEGHDTAYLHGSEGNDTVIRKDEYTKIYNDDFFLRSKYFEETTVYGKGGEDTAYLFDTELNDELTARDNWATLSNVLFSVKVSDFATVHADSQRGGRDHAYTLHLRTPIVLPTIEFIGPDFDCVLHGDWNPDWNLDPSEIGPIFLVDGSES